MIRNRLIAFAAGLRFPNLLALAVALFLIDLIVPDVIPFADEILLGLIAVLVAMIKKKNGRP